MIETLLNEGSDDSIFISAFENAASEVFQNDEELAVSVSRCVQHVSRSQKALERETSRVLANFPAWRDQRSSQGQSQRMPKASSRKGTAPLASVWSNESVTRVATGRLSVRDVEAKHPPRLLLSALMPFCRAIPKPSVGLSFMLNLCVLQARGI